MPGVYIRKNGKSIIVFRCSGSLTCLVGGWNSVVVTSLILVGIEVYALLINQLEPPLKYVLVDGTELLVLMSRDHSKK